MVLQQQSACGSCHAAGLCGMAEVAEKAVEVPTDPYATYGVGDEVEVLLKATMAYCIPLVILLAVILSLIGLGVQEAVTGLVGLGAIGIYYLVLYLMRDKLRNVYIFMIKG